MCFMCHRVLRESLLSISVVSLTPSVIRHHSMGKPLRKYKMFGLKTICTQEPAYQKIPQWNERGNSKHEMFGLLKVLLSRAARYL